MNKLSNSELTKLIPENLRNDPDIKSASIALDSGFQFLALKSDELNILFTLDQQTEEVLDHLLWAFHITGSEGKDLAENKQEKIDLIKNSIRLHETKGTKGSILRAFKSLGMDAEIKEWFEYGGDPYHFRIEIVEVRSRELPEKTLKAMEAMANTFKNKRSFLEVINIRLLSSFKQNIGAAFYSGETMTLLPQIITERTEQANINWGLASSGSESITVLPQIITSRTDKTTMNWGIASRYSELISVYPN